MVGKFNFDSVYLGQATWQCRFTFRPGVLKEHLHMFVDLINGCAQSQMLQDWGDDLLICYYVLTAQMLIGTQSKTASPRPGNKCLILGPLCTNRWAHGTVWQPQSTQSTEQKCSCGSPWKLFQKCFKILGEINRPNIGFQPDHPISKSSEKWKKKGGRWRT